MTSDARRGTGEVVHRTVAGRREQADHMLAAIRAGLDRLTLAQFADEWSVRLTPDQ